MPQLLALLSERRGQGPAAAARQDRSLGLYGIFSTISVLRRWLLDGPPHRCHDRVDDAPRAARAAREHLRRERLQGSVSDGWGARSASALRAFQRQPLIVSQGRLDQETAPALVAGSWELGFRAPLRALRERVADAAGLIEDGPAAGQVLDGAAFRAAARPLSRGAPDLLSQATAAAALGWTGPAAAFLRDRAPADLDGFQVAVRPPPPRHHADPLDPPVGTDRGDVWCDYPPARGAARRAAAHAGARRGPRRTAGAAPALAHPPRRLAAECQLDAEASRAPAAADRPSVACF